MVPGFKYRVFMFFICFIFLSYRYRSLHAQRSHREVRGQGQVDGGCQQQVRTWCFFLNHLGMPCLIDSFMTSWCIQFFKFFIAFWLRMIPCTGAGEAHEQRWPVFILVLSLRLCTYEKCFLFSISIRTQFISFQIISYYFTNP